MKNTVVTTKRGRMPQIPNPPKPKIARIKALPPLGQVMLYKVDTDGYVRGYLGVPVIGCNELGTDINA